MSKTEHQPPKNVALAALIVAIIGAFFLVFALALNQATRNLIINYLELGETLWGHWIYAFIMFIIVAFVIMIVSIYYPNLTKRAF